MKQVCLILVVLLAACSHVVSKEAREKVDRGVTAAEVIENPSAFEGRTVMLGGAILNTTNATDGSRVLVLESPLDRRGRPSDIDRSRGRFVIYHEGWLDPAIYSRGRLVTVVGEVTGEATVPVDEVEKQYPVIRSIELHLVKPGSGPDVRIGVGIFHSF